MSEQAKPKKPAGGKGAAPKGAAAKRGGGKAPSSGTTALRREAEVVRLARAFGVDEHELDFLEGADVDALRELRFALSDRLFDLASAGLRKSAALAGKVPAPLTAKLGEHALGPVLSGRIVPMLDKKLIGEITERMPAHFLAEAAVHLDLRHAAPLIVAVSQEKLEAAGAELARKREFVVLAAFVGFMDEQVLGGLLSVFDAETLLRAAFLVEEPQRIDALVAHLDDSRLDDLNRVAREHDLWEEAFVMLAGLGETQRGRFAQSIVRLGADHQAAIAAELKANPTLASAAKPLLAQLDAETRAVLAPA